MKKVLVVIPQFNKLLLLKECLIHLEKQDYTNFDTLIVDNGSSDGSAQYIFDLSNNDERYHSILLNQNTGFAYAVNKGIQYAIDNGYEYTLLLNNDAYVEEDFVRSLVSEISKKEKRFAVSSLMINYHKKDIIDSFGDNYSLLGWAFQNRIDESVDNILNNELCFSACGGASIYRNSVFKKIGLFDDNFFAYLEDVDVSYRAKLSGYSISNCKEARCYHLGSATSGSKYNKFKVRLSARNNIYLIVKNMPFLQILLNIFPLTLGIIIKQLFFIKKGFGLDYFFGLFDAWRSLDSIIRVDFKKVPFYRLVGIEIELVVNTFKYIYNYLIRHI